MSSTTLVAEPTAGSSSWVGLGALDTLDTVRKRHDEWMRGLLEHEAAFDDPRDRLLAVFTHLEHRLVADGHRAWSDTAHAGAGAAADGTDLVDLLHDQLRQVEAHVAERCAAAALPAHLGQALTLLLHGAHVEATVHRSVQPVRTARTAAAMLLAVHEGDALF
ncbi:hypothetical protein KK092_00040 [Curtobacterium flaccumfaciens pv. flaccumfaciens]|uniref:hypothetical protein n=1 Tax=Curtobacterium flaccumfaciens TaxID=2035 RepID=UPI001BDDE9DE|nr:hypothetical protein [Curtobacterium flaccumfaciens]MBT1667753.1 hypothetical protein [Curtobacterium flaccumfaciens pv. flaccumfaciens]